MNEYIASLDDLKQIYVNYGGTASLERLEARSRAFDRLIREIQDEAYEEGWNQHGWENE